MKSVLIVDDSRFARLSVRRIIEATFPDWYIAEAGDGAEALSILADVAADVILLDYNMPGDDGITVARKVRETRPEVRIAILTANVQEALSERARDNGLHFIKKPAKDTEVAAFLRGA